MSFWANKRKRKICIWVTSIVVILAIIVGACAVYVNDYYRADAVSIAAFAPINTITKEVLDDNTIVYAPENATTGLIFYPGGKVEYTAYAPLMQACADRGILCVLVEMPFNGRCDRKVCIESSIEGCWPRSTRLTGTKNMIGIKVLVQGKKSSYETNNSQRAFHSTGCYFLYCSLIK